MIASPIRSRSLWSNARLDANYFLSPGVVASERLAIATAMGMPRVHLTDSPIRADVSAPSRFRRAYAMAGEASLPYLRPYDVFEYLPLPADHLSLARTRGVDAYRVEPGTLLLTCSGRNLGPAVIADEYLAGFLLSHDMVRVKIADANLRGYIAAFLSSPTGQALIRRDKTGSVVDHISVDHVAGMDVPLLPAPTRRKVAKRMLEAVELRSSARSALVAGIGAYAEAFSRARQKVKRAAGGWTVKATTLGGRVDAAFHHPDVRADARSLLRAGGVRLGEAAEVLKPAGRYKTAYVSATHGRPMLSGRQILQARPINLKHIAPSALDRAERYELQPGSVIFQADGRAEERLGQPVVVTGTRSGWLASGHVGRVVPRDPADSGWLFLALSMGVVQRQVKALACGSVVDALCSDDLARVVLPPRLEQVELAEHAWDDFDRALRLEDEAIALFEAALTHCAAQ